jgi:hypothetical protein
MDLRLYIVTMALLAGPAAHAARPPAGPQPPMNQFDFAFYTCDNQGSFQISYDSETPKTATLTSNQHNKQYALVRKPGADGIQFAGDGAKFWTDGKKVVVEGTAARLENCKRQAN